LTRSHGRRTSRRFRAQRARNAHGEQPSIGEHLAQGHASLLSQKVLYPAISALSGERIANTFDVTRAHAIERERWMDRQPFAGARDPIAKEHIDRREDAVLEIDKCLCPGARPENGRRPHREVMRVIERVLADALQWRGDLEPRR